MLQKNDNDSVRGYRKNAQHAQAEQKGRHQICSKPDSQ